VDKITIAIDGYSSTGAMYRAVTLFALERGFISQEKVNTVALISELPNIQLSFKFNHDLGFAEMYLNNENVEKKIRSMEVSSFVSQVATIPEIRQQLVKQQQNMGEDKGVVMDGRDIGTVVFPDAELKIFMVASAETKAKRRYKELIDKGEKVEYEEVLNNVKERDHIDSHREDSPLIKADDAIEIDNSHLTLDEQFEVVMQLVRMTLEDTE